MGKSDGVTFSDPPDDMRQISKRMFLASWDLQGKDQTVRVVRLQTANMSATNQIKEGGVAGALYFAGPSGKEHKKPVKMNVTNTNVVTKLYGVSGKAGKNWVGKLITLYPTTTRMAGETVDCIRIRPIAPAAASALSHVPEDAPVNEEMSAKQDAAAARIAEGDGNE